MKQKFFLLLVTLLTSSLLLAACQSYSGGTNPPLATPSTKFQPEPVLGVQGDPQTSYPGIPWVRLSYPTCVTNQLAGQVLKDAISSYHRQGIHVLLTYCQVSGDRLFDTARFNDAAQGGADAVQCGNEQMKQGPFTTYITPERFAQFFTLCQNAMHAVRPDIPIILGAMQPLVVPDDNAKLAKQVQYLDAMQSAMNSSVHPGGKWDWHAQILGLIDSWHNGYPDATTNNLAGLFDFWATQLRVSLNSGDLGKHLWVVEGTGCVNGCGIDATSAREIAISHILTMISDVQTVLRYHVPFFYFSGKDFFQSGQSQFWPMGVLDANGHLKPLRQDLAMGARSLEMSCTTGKVRVIDQEQLLAKLYAACTLPATAISDLQS